MRVSKAVFAATCVAAAQANSLWEGPDFDVTQALLQNGVAVGELASLTASGDGCQLACDLLRHLYGSERLVAQETQPAAYANTTQAYWATQQREAQPACIFTPGKNTDVSILVLLARLTSCPFAAKSGGHAAFAGASSSEGGITVLLKDLNEITLNANKSIASVGPGNVWSQVYSALEPHGLAVVGGRVADIGVGGLTTGGGISFYSNLYGWALDNVESYEVVTATGEIILASEHHHPDLYWALRGGGNNFGLVTKLNLYTIPSSPLRATTRVYAGEHAPDVISGYVNTVRTAATDPHAALYVGFGRFQGSNIALSELAHTSNAADPEIFRPFRAIPALADTTATRSLVNYTWNLKEANPDGLREVYWMISVRLDEDLLKWAVAHLYEILPSVEHVEGILPVLVYQGISGPMLQNMQRAGGNALGLDPSGGEVSIVHIACWWNKKEDDDTVYALISGYMDAVKERSREMGVDHDYIYMNYASKFQDVVASYGKVNKERLVSIARRYDPRGVFQVLQPGYFKLAGAPAVNPY